MTTVLLVRRFLDDYRRNAVNAMLLVLVPVVFVVLVADQMGAAAELLGGVGGAQTETASAGWAAAFLAAIAMYFQTAATRDTDRRLVLASLPTRRLVLARLVTGLALAAIASAVALLALAARRGIDDPGRVVAGTLMFAVIYVAIGAVVGVLARNPVNGSVVVLFVWILDVFFGPAMGAADRLATRGLPTHFVTLWMVDLPSGHSGRPSDLGWALAWTAAALAVAWALVARRSRIADRARRPWRAGSAQFSGALHAAWRDSRRNPAQWALFVAVPAVFVLGADAVTPDEPITLSLVEHGIRAAQTMPMPQVHGATMAPIAITTLAALAGLFTMLDSRSADARVALAGLSTRALFQARLAVLSATAVVAMAVSLAATWLVFDASRWTTYAAGNLLLALTYALIGALLAPLLGRVAGVFAAFMLPFVDVGITQSPMLNAEPTTLATLLPGAGGSRVLIDGALTSGFDEARSLVVGLVWLAGLLVAVYVAYRRSATPMTKSPKNRSTWRPPTWSPFRSSSSMSS